MKAILWGPEVDGVVIRADGFCPKGAITPLLVERYFLIVGCETARGMVRRRNKSPRWIWEVGTPCNHVRGIAKNQDEAYAAMIREFTTRAMGEDSVSEPILTVRNRADFEAQRKARADDPTVMFVEFVDDGPPTYYGRGGNKGEGK